MSVACQVFLLFTKMIVIFLTVNVLLTNICKFINNQNRVWV